MSNEIPPISSSQAQKSQQASHDQEQAITPQDQKKLHGLAGDLQSAAQQIDIAKSNNQAISDNTVSLIDTAAHQLKDIIPKVHDVAAQNALTQALQQIQIVVQNPDAVTNASGQLTGASMTITEVISQ